MFADPFAFERMNTLQFVMKIWFDWCPAWQMGPSGHVFWWLSLNKLLLVSFFEFSRWQKIKMFSLTRSHFNAWTLRKNWISSAPCVTNVTKSNHNRWWVQVIDCCYFWFYTVWLKLSVNMNGILILRQRGILITWCGWWHSDCLTITVLLIYYLPPLK